LIRISRDGLFETHSSIQSSTYKPLLDIQGVLFELLDISDPNEVLEKAELVGLQVIMLIFVRPKRGCCQPSWFVDGPVA
jgi:hypothetical protein